MRRNESEEAFYKRLEQYFLDNEGGLSMKKINSKKSFQNQDIVFMFPYFVWLILFVLAPIFLLIYQSLLSIDGALRLKIF